MLFTTWITFLGLTILATGSPGPGSLLALSSGLYHGRKRALFTIVGSLLGLLLLFMVALIGLYTLFKQQPLFFKMLAFVGVFYLVYTGIKKWRQEIPFFVGPQARPSKSTLSNMALFKEGFLVAISNPKVILFFSIFFTPFISTQAPWAVQMTILAVTFFVCELSWQLVYAFAGDKLTTLFKHRQHYILFNRATGIFFLGSACFIAYNLSYKLT